MARDASYLIQDGDDREFSGRDRKLPWRKANRRGDDAPQRSQQPARTSRAVRRGPTRAAREGREEFRCRHCRALIGPTISGGRHRNHCPLCLHSRHVDDRRPGDRASECGALMAPVGRFARPNGEPVIVHRCLGCDLERHNRIAADDAILILMRLPLVPPRGARVAAADEQKQAEA